MTNPRNALASTVPTGADELSRSPESHLARAIFARVVVDLYDPDNRISGDARAWLYADDRPALTAWRDDLALLADIDLEALRDATDDAPMDRLRKIARLLDKGGSW